jgi:hypothetical protein
MRTYDETVDQLANNLVEDYREGGHKFAYSVNRDIAWVYDTTVSKITDDVMVRFAVLVGN